MTDFCQEKTQLRLEKMRIETLWVKKLISQVQFIKWQMSGARKKDSLKITYHIKSMSEQQPFIQTTC